MERLTKRFESAVVYIGKRMANKDTGDIPCECSSAAVREILHRLSAYEDTGLTPDEVKAIHKFFNDRTMAEFEKLHDLLAAEAEGRLVVLPCKVGATVYVTDLTEGKVEECEVACFNAIDENGCGCIEYNAPKDYPQIVSVECGLDEIGKTVFLTREEAEEKLKGESDG